jgi:hypothetical protein
MRTWAAACVVFVLLLSSILWIEYRLAHPTVPPGVQRSECLTPPPQAESGVDSLARLGGRITRNPNAQWQGDFYTAADIVQGRDLSKYDKLELRDKEHFHPWEMWRNPILAQARIFLWQHWSDRKRGYLILTMSSVDYTGTSHLFVESDDSGRWRVYRRHLGRRDLVDQPTAYSLMWVTRQASNKPTTPVPAGQASDPMTAELEFRDVCGEAMGSF